MKSKNIQQDINTLSESWTVPRSRSNKELLNTIIKNVDLEEESKSTPRLNRWQMAASVILLIGLSTGALFVLGSKKVNTGFNENKICLLPDGSTVELNYTSELKYNSFFFSLSRKVYLKGEAFFQVKKGKQFSVLTSDSRVEVLGTSFNVKNRSKHTHVYCNTGKVRVSNNIGESTILLPGLQTSSSKLDLAKTSPKANPSIWKEKSFAFHSESLDEIFNEIETCYGVNIVYSEKLKERHYSGSFERVNALSDLAYICKSMGLYFKEEENKIIIY